VIKYSFFIYFLRLDGFFFSQKKQMLTNVCKFSKKMITNLDDYEKKTKKQKWPTLVTTNVGSREGGATHLRV